RMRPKTGIRALSTTIKISQTARNPGSGKADKLSTRGSGWQFPSQRLLSGFHCGQGTPMNAVIDFLNNIFWSYILVYGLLAVGAFFTLRLGFIQFRHFGDMVRAIIGARQSDQHGISPFHALCTSLASRIGTGNIAGVAVALYLGGPGAIFWMWVVALVGMATGYAESTLAQLYKVEDRRGQYRGGPAFYIARGLKAPWAGAIFAVSLILSFGLIFNAVQ